MFQLLLAIIYLAFISLGLPDSLLGAAWPSMYPEFQVPVSYAGIISMVIALGTVISSLMSDRLTKRLGAGLVTAISVAMTALALFGFSFSHSFWVLILWSIPYGLGAGSVDAALNNYVALHYKSRHMSWLHLRRPVYHGLRLKSRSELEWRLSLHRYPAGNTYLYPVHQPATLEEREKGCSIRIRCHIRSYPDIT